MDTESVIKLKRKQHFKMWQLPFFCPKTVNNVSNRHHDFTPQFGRAEKYTNSRFDVNIFPEKTSQETSSATAGITRKSTTIRSDVELPSNH